MEQAVSMELVIARQVFLVQTVHYQWLRLPVVLREYCLLKQLYHNPINP
jgi:hypothetical protein